MKRYLLLLSLVCAFALHTVAEDIPFRQQRREIFEVLPGTDADVVFLGNSITNFGAWPEFFGRDLRVVNRGISGNYSGEVLEHLSLAIGAKPAKLFLMIGINDYQNTACIIPNIRRIVEVTRRESPATQIYIQSLLPCNRNDRHGMVEPVNTELKALCEEMDVPYIDVYSKVVNDAVTPPAIAAQYTNDNLHVTAAGYREWTSDFEQYVGAAPVFDSTSGKSLGSLVPFENIMYSQFCMLPVLDGDYLMLGDYNVHAGEWAELMNSRSVLNRGIGLGWGYTLSVDKLRAIIPDVVKGNPAGVFVQCGMKELYDGVAPATLMEKYQAAVADILSRASNATVYVQSPIPSTEAARNSNIEAFSNLLREYAAATDRVEFVDVYAALTDGTGVLAEKFRGANTVQSRGINGRGYLRWANVLADATNGALTARPELTDEQFALRTGISAARRMLYGTDAGTLLGNVSAGALDSLRQRIDGAEALLNTPEATADTLVTELAGLNDAVALFSGKKVQPAGGHSYKISSPLRGGTFVSCRAKGAAITSEPEADNDNQIWDLAERADGTFDITLRLDGAYISTSASDNTQMRTTSRQPSAGWTFTPVDGTPYFIITSGSVQMNRTPQAKIFNWGGGHNNTDTGCQFLLTEVPAKEQSGINEIGMPSTGTENVIYDLQGRRVSAPAHGIYIVDGQKRRF